MTTLQKLFALHPFGSDLILLARFWFTQILKGESDQIGCTQDLKIVIVDDKIGQNKHEATSNISA